MLGWKLWEWDGKWGKLHWRLWTVLKVTSCTIRVTVFARWCRLLSVIEIWIYFSFLEFWRSAESGMLSKDLAERC
jgi:hypothetical protein